METLNLSGASVRMQPLRLARLLLLWLLLGLPILVQAQFSYTNNNNAVTITRYTGPGGVVVIPGTIDGYPVTSIGNSAFASCSSLTSVTIPNSVTNIGGYAFDRCSSLTSVTIPNSVTRIGGYAFYYCSGLTNVTIPNSVTSIGFNAFNHCSSLTSVTISDRLASLDDAVFCDCYSLTNVTIPNSVTNIGFNAFNRCISLTSVTIPNSVTSIQSGAFFSCYSLTNVTIPNSVTNIGLAPFAYCRSLIAVMVDANNPSYSSVEGVLFDKLQRLLIAYPGRLSGSYAIPPGVIRIEEYAFAGCGRLTNVTIPNSVTRIDSDAFANCSTLQAVYFQGNAPSIGGNLFWYDHLTVYYLPGTAGWGSTFGAMPTAPWYPVIVGNDAGFGVRTNGFGFTISWATNASVVVEACTNLAQANWFPVSTNTLLNGTTSFSDPQWTNYPCCFYRIGLP